MHDNEATTTPHEKTKRMKLGHRSAGCIWVGHPGAFVDTREPRPKDAGPVTAIAEGTLTALGPAIPCYILDDGQRALHARGIIHAFLVGPVDTELWGLEPQPGDGPDEADEADVDDGVGPTMGQIWDTIADFDRPRRIPVQTSKGVVDAIAAADFVEMLGAYEDALAEGRLTPRTYHLAVHSMNYLRILSMTGLEPLIDKATGRFERGPAGN